MNMYPCTCEPPEESKLSQYLLDSVQACKIMVIKKIIKIIKYQPNGNTIPLIHSKRANKYAL